MKEINVKEPAYLEEYDIHVNRHLTLDQIQSIANEMMKRNVWAEREQIKNYMVLCYATDLGKEAVDELDADAVVQSGMMDKIIYHIDNIWCVYEAIEYHESTGRLLQEIAKFMEKITVDDIKAMTKAVVDNAELQK